MEREQPQNSESGEQEKTAVLPDLTRNDYDLEAAEIEQQKHYSQK